MMKHVLSIFKDDLFAINQKMEKFAIWLARLTLAFARKTASKRLLLFFVLSITDVKLRQRFYLFISKS